MGTGPGGTELAALAGRHAPKSPAGLVLARMRAGTVQVASAGPVAEDWVFELGSISKARARCAR